MSVKENIEQVARVCHEANRAYCQTIGDDSQPTWDQAPQWQKDSAINGVKFHVAHLSAGDRPSPSASHESWMKQKADEGWKFGPVKDAAKKEHPCFVPYNELPLDQRMKDYVFAAIAEAFWRASQVEVAA